jgi:DNA processing protein
MSDLPTPRELLIALHADQRLTRRQLGRLAGEVIGWARGRPAAAPPTLPALLQRLAAIGARGRDADAPPAAPAGPTSPASPASPAWSTPSGAIAAAAAEIAAAAACGARVITVLDPEYPQILAGMAQAPPVLAVRGLLPPGPAVAIVGSRHADGYGIEVAAHFARCLAGAGVAIVSGMAHGIDAAAHQGALAMPPGRTVGVLGCGVGFDYPRGHQRLAAAVAARGALVSEFACGARPQPWRFPVRNRTIAGLAAVTLVVQATPRSGSLDTARHARDLGRPVFAVPGPVFAPLSWGPHSLLRSGALLAGHPQDVVDALSAWASARRDPTTVTVTAADRDAAGGNADGGGADGGDAALGAAGDATEAGGDDAAAPAADAGALRPVLAALRRRTAHSAEQVAASTGLPPGTVLGALLELEIAGKVERLRGSVWRLAKTRRRHWRAAARTGARAP